MQLHAGRATIPAPAGLQAGTPDLVISGGSDVVYGDLNGTGGDVAALNVWCSNTGGTADGQIQNSWVVFSADSGTLTVIGVLVPQQPADANLPHVPYFNSGPGGIAIASGSITVEELWYAPSDETCCPSGKATTVWTLAHGAFTPTTSMGWSAG
jgi:hypothetical protein